VTQVSATSSTGTCSLRKARLASIILATVRPDAEDEPKFDGIWKPAEVTVVPVLKFSDDRPPASWPICAVVKNAPIRRSSHSRATALAATLEYCAVGSIRSLSLSKLSINWLASLSTGNTHLLVKSTSCLSIGANLPAGVFIWIAPMYCTGDACLP